MAASIAVLFSAVPDAAHREALFGPQSASVLSPDSFLGAQVFSRRSGRPGERTPKTTTVLSGGFSPAQDGRLSIALVVPFSFVTQQGSAVLVHPTVTWGLNRQVLLLALTSIPVRQSWRGLDCLNSRS